MPGRTAPGCGNKNKVCLYYSCRKRFKKRRLYPRAVKISFIQMYLALMWDAEEKASLL